MQQITDYAAVDRELAGRVARFQAVTDTQFEPWHQPHFNVQHDSAPAPAEAATDVVVDDEKKEPQSEGERMLMLVIFALSAAAALSLVLIGVQRLGLL